MPYRRGMTKAFDKIAGGLVDAIAYARDLGNLSQVASQAETIKNEKANELGTAPGCRDIPF